MTKKEIPVCKFSPELLRREDEGKAYFYRVLQCETCCSNSVFKRALRRGITEEEKDEIFSELLKDNSNFYCRSNYGRLRRNKAHDERYLVQINELLRVYDQNKSSKTECDLNPKPTYTNRYEERTCPEWEKEFKCCTCDLYRSVRFHDADTAKEISEKTASFLANKKFKCAAIDAEERRQKLILKIRRCDAELAEYE